MSVFHVNPFFSFVALQRPTALAKLLGVYRIGFKNSQTNTTMRQDVLVMENLFYERKVNKVTRC